MTLDKPGIYADVPEVDYHSDPLPTPSLSSSVGKLLVEATPRHAWMAHPRLNPAYESRRSAAFDTGNAAHRLMLGAGAEIKVLQFADFRTKVAQQARDDAYAAGQIPMLADKYQPVADMIEAARAQLAHHDDAWAAFRPGYGAAEQTVVWQEQPDASLPAVWCRARPDWLPSNGGVCFDFKTTSSMPGPDDWGARDLFNFGYDFQAAFYTRGLMAVTGKHWHFELVVVEIAPPYSLAVHALSGQAMEIAAANVETAIRKWQWCLAKNAWPGFSKSTYWNDAPVWRARAHEARQLSDETDRDQLAHAMAFQAPIQIATDDKS